MKSPQKIHIHLVSDSTGETVHQISRACLAQFPNVKTIEHIWTLVRSQQHLDSVFTSLESNPGVLLMSILDIELRSQIENKCESLGVPHVSVLDPVVTLFGTVLGQSSQNNPGGQRQLNSDYYQRISAIDFAVSHDDGMNMGALKDADILLVGVSRSSKTPTSMYLAHRGYKVSNYALVPGIPFPIHYLDGLNILVVGLTNDPKRLSVIRRTRQIAMSDNANETYADLVSITEEVRQARRLFRQNQWPVIDVTRRSIEETAAAIIQLHTNWNEGQQ